MECITALLPNNCSHNYDKIPYPSVCILIPAHNEASGIGMTLSSLKSQLTIKDRVIVVADNCTDDTAKIAREYGVTVIERNDTLRRGKGYALDFGLQYIKANPPEVVIFIDADCIVHPGTVEKLAKTAIFNHLPVQSTNLLKPPQPITPRHAVLTLAFLVKNLVRQRGMRRLKLSASLTGTGMAVPWFLINKVSFASSNIVEDKQLGLDFTLAGYTPIFCEEALVTGYFPQQQKAGETQKTRWVHGHLETLRSQFPKLIKAGILQKRLDLIAIALDLTVLPISLLMMLWFVSAVFSYLMAMALGIIWLPVITLIQGVLILIAIVSAWMKFGRAELPTRMLLSIPFYMFWNMGIYWSFLMKPQKSWVRTGRD
ncbi:glycosyltransferase family 2 protein [Calothrix sp. UHCC 0171]|uniref:glycosyltransferase family 2 protein n=1 Tax=Calothrix sp. UHCC 0171 TaxID=3110245 RepID=UPI002B1F79E3|nr:glycosyltransferase family 2 protein [Calothrix sp. UHCC 0171]MEA5569853.1 glycosyltransferase family 2 protein [Calothrix sp. UHCC 0171]